MSGLSAKAGGQREEGGARRAGRVCLHEMREETCSAEVSTVLASAA